MMDDSKEVVIDKNLIFNKCTQQGKITDNWNNA